ncbi:MAG TPA: hypothetical protein VIP80_09770 [Gemmatimonadales bacterium]
MKLIVANIQWIMLLSGALTCTMVYAALAPRQAFLARFGEPLEGPAAELVVRNWGALITLVGAMLVYGAFVPPTRPLVLLIAGGSKLVFIGLVLSHGRRYWRGQARVAVISDLVMVALFAGYLAGGW